jgi:Carboxypeptidase regulatory-like domain
LFGAALLLFVASLSAQTTSATIIGDIRDPSDSAVVGATVTVKNAATGISRAVQTDAAGSYRVYPLNPGTFDVSVSAPGFKTQVRAASAPI